MRGRFPHLAGDQRLAGLAFIKGQHIALQALEKGSGKILKILIWKNGVCMEGGTSHDTKVPSLPISSHV